MTELEWWRYGLVAFQLAGLSLQIFFAGRAVRFGRSADARFRKAGADAVNETMVFWLAYGMRTERLRWIRAICDGEAMELEPYELGR
jgi:hypothetical protein